MGKFLQIRLTARTFDPEEVVRHWPKLAALAWPVGRPGPTPVTGVAELAEALYDQFRFGEWDAETKKALGPAVERVAKAKRSLDEALADWNPREADQASYGLEDALGEVEKLAPNP